MVYEKRCMGFYLCAGILLLLFLAASSSSYTPPSKIPVQGRLTNASTGTALPGTHDLTFRIYNASTAGTMLWEENQTLILDSAGLWSTYLGNNTGLDLNFSEDTWLEIEIDHDATPLPRVQLASVPYSKRTDIAANLSCVDCIGVDEIQDVYLLNTGDNAAGNYTINGSLRIDNSTGSTVLYVNTSNGNVGIGTTGPGTKLEIAGNVFVGDSGAIRRIKIFGDSQGAVLSSDTAAGIYQSLIGGSYPFDNTGHLVIQSRSSSERET